MAATSLEPSLFTFPTEFPYESDSFASFSDLNSPLESAVSSTDSTDSSGSDDDDFFEGLAHQFAWTSLSETDKSTSPSSKANNFEKKYVKTGSPQSTLSGIDTWFRSETPSQVQSPPLAVSGAVNDARALVHAAAAIEATRLKMSRGTTLFHSNVPFARGFVGARSSVPVESVNEMGYGLFLNRNCDRNLAFAAQAQQVKRDLVLQALSASSWGRQAKVGWSAQPHWKPEFQNREGTFVDVRGRCSGGSGDFYHSPWLSPPRHQQPTPNASAATRCIHPGRSGVKRASSGTGVFLPRRYVNPSESFQKKGSPAVRFPEMRCPIQAPLNGFLSPGFNSISSRRNKPVLPLPRSFRGEVGINQEQLHLPQEWTY
ncbi:hypothetical protein SDJN03_22880, partial [Cucurbita argyrosperma subsp. sororia]